MPVSRPVLTLLAGLLLLLFFAPAASADVDDLVVNDTGDGGDLVLDDVCEVSSAAGDCTLRAALQEQNDGDATDLDTIEFHETQVPSGTTIDVTALASNTQIDEPVTIDGCVKFVGDPCIGVNDVGGQAVLFAINGGSGVTIRNLALTSALTAVNQVAGTGLNLQGNYFGVQLDGITADSADSNVTSIRVTGDNATIGGDTAADRNLIVNSTSEGLRIFGGDGAAVRGNSFGVKTDGDVSSNLQNIEVSTRQIPSDFATNNTIGGTAPGPSCAAPCNVIAGATSSGIDLSGVDSGEDMAVATTIAGNFIGMRADGSAAPNGYVGILADGVLGVTIGGAAAGEGNRITGGGVGIQVYDQIGEANHAPATDVVVRGNSIGVNPAGTALLSPPTIGADIVAGRAPNAAQFIGNRVGVSAQGSSGLVLRSGGSIVTGNTGGLVTGNTFGVGSGGENLSSGSAAIVAANLHGATISGNVLANASAPPGGFYGNNGLILLGSSNNTVTGNLIGTDASGADRGNAGPGIRIASLGMPGPSTGNVIGGDALAEQNVISNNNGDAIEVLDSASDNNQFRGNRGADNVDPLDVPNSLFIDLNGDGPDPLMPAHNVNGGIGAPLITSSGASTASGTSAPGSTVRLFSKVSPSAGEIEGLLGQAVADGNGAWTVNHAAGLPDNKLVTAHQTGATGTSELSTPFPTDVPAAPATPLTPVTPAGPVAPVTPTGTGFDLAAVLKACKKKKSKRARKNCIKRARLGAGA